MGRILFSAILGLYCSQSMASTFFDSFGTSQLAFRKSCEEKTDAKLNQIKHEASGLAIDYCHYFTGNSKALIIVTSGLHGVEGFAGSAIQRHLLKKWQETKSFDVLMIHGLNPWGFKYKRRVNQRNVDLNRNFVSAGKGFEKKNFAYRSLTEFLNPREKASSGFFDKIGFYLSSIRLVMREGKRQLRQAILEGQYEISTGIFFGGAVYQPLKVYVTDVFDKYVLNRGYDTIVFVDLHTGYGKKGSLHVLPSLPKGEKYLKAFKRYFGQRGLTKDNSEHFYEVTGELAAYFGHYIVSQDKAVTVLPMVFEYGTMNNQTLSGSLRALYRVIKENQLYWYGATSESAKESVRENFFRMFSPNDPSWRRSVLLETDTVLDPAIGKLTEN